LAAAGGRAALWIQTDFAALEAGIPYGPGLDLFGLPLRHLLILRVSRPLDLLWAFEEALKSRGIAAVLAELPESGAAADLTATRPAGAGSARRRRARPAAAAPPLRARLRGDDALAGRRRRQPARRLWRARAHRFRSLAPQEPARPLWPLDYVLEPR
jgi:protein ImuA